MSIEIGVRRYLMVMQTQQLYPWRKNKEPSVVVTDSDVSIREVVRDESLRRLFNIWLYANIGPEEFELEWKKAADEYGLHDTVWGNQVYRKKEKWCDAFLQDKFCVGYRITFRYEMINSKYQNNELLLQFRSIYAVPMVTTSLESLERCSTGIYTKAIFKDVKKEIDDVLGLNFVRVGQLLTTKVYTVGGICSPGESYRYFS
ncbi:hypothetical protein Ahy_B08g092578 isoform A [Arachis hypogaea]|uniref:Protein FAR1-RELATED SEQUENCE n=1 Tax=Arachis hypogaea TaxID=3818 RepID=A0A444Y432_ARAHY|nr:hypothetical protein Ahy_B08g092578 isoform A [Arachis hypogaea]